MVSEALAPVNGNRSLAGFMSMGLLAGIANGTAKVLLPLYAAALHASAAQIGLVGGLQFLGLLLLSIPIGSLLERIDSRALFFVGGVGGAVVYALMFPVIETSGQLLLCVALFGLLNPFRMVTTQTEFLYLLHHLSHRRAGWNRAAHTSGMFFLGPSLGAFVLTVLGFTAAFQISALVLLLAVLIGNRTLSALPGRQLTQGTAVTERFQGFFRVVRERKDLRRSIGIEFVGQMAMTYFNVFIILIGTRAFGMSTQAGAALVTLQGACFVGALFTLGGVLTALTESKRYALSFAVLIVAEICLMVPLSPWMLAAGAVLLGIGLGIQHLTSVTRFAALTHELGRGQVGGIFTISGPAGGLVGSVCGGVLAQRFGLLAGFRVLFALYVIQLGLAFYRREIHVEHQT